MYFLEGLLFFQSKAIFLHVRRFFCLFWGWCLGFASWWNQDTKFMVFHYVTGPRKPFPFKQFLFFTLVFTSLLKIHLCFSPTTLVFKNIVVFIMFDSVMLVFFFFFFFRNSLRNTLFIDHFFIFVYFGCFLFGFCFLKHALLWSNLRCATKWSFFYTICFQKSQKLVFWGCPFWPFSSAFSRKHYRVGWGPILQEQKSRKMNV